MVERLREPGAAYFDIGCCFGQDLWQLVVDGVPSEKLVGLDIEGPLMELGSDFCLDRATLRSRFVVADVLRGRKQGKAWTELERGSSSNSDGGFDVLHCSAFFHLFPLVGDKGGGNMNEASPFYVGLASAVVRWRQPAEDSTMEE